MENMKEKNHHPLPHELVVEILLRLPVRSLLRFKCVCKPWSSLISDTQFAKSHFDLNAAPIHRLLLHRFDDEVDSFDLESSLDDTSAIVTLNFPPPSKSCFLNPLRFLGSCRGFILVSYEATDDVIVWNPSTGFHRKIRGLESGFMSNSLYVYGFGYDKLTDDYCLVRIALVRVVAFGLGKAKVQTFSLKTSSWCDTGLVNVEYMDFGRDSKQGVFLNDSLHWLVVSIRAELPVVVAFDLVEKSLSEIPISPILAAKLTRKEYHLRVLGGCLSLCYPGEGDGRKRAEIWVMKEYKVESSWTKTFVMNFCHIPVIHFFPICFIEGGRVVGSDGYGNLMKFNAKGKLLKHDRYAKEYGNFLKYFEMYRESLLLFPDEQPLLNVQSLPCDISKTTENEEEDGTKDEEEDGTEDEEADGTGDEEEDGTEDEKRMELKMRKRKQLKMKMKKQLKMRKWKHLKMKKQLKLKKRNQLKMTCDLQ